MSKYKLYGIGNALLDYEYKINDQILEDLGLEKGCMLLNEYDKHFDLHEKLKTMRPPEKIIPGGSVANSVYAMAQFSDHVCFSGKVSDDDSGLNFINCLNQSGVNTVIPKINDQKSGECLVLITPDNERTMNTYLGSSSLLNENDISIESIKDSTYLLIEGYLVTSEETLNVGISAIKSANQNDTKTVITLSDPNIVSFFRDNMMKLFNNNAHIVFCNEQEALNFSQTNNLNDAQTFLKGLTDMYIITLGCEGAICYDGKETHRVDGHQVDSKDFTGAGDMFLGAFMHKYKDKNILESMEFANYCASKIIQIYGAKFHNANDYKEMQNEFKSSI
ncbi:MAG: adenosine kinase [Gammaproteobacteria bacterium]|nr:adenosine kinase [Gammaproteobacteria bacterium]MBT7322791.1 adenosine kinase [Gammaproteobacteria bacterium]MDG2159299.1 adenosine kinase [Gammaproteobacteria bacterium]